MGASPAGGPTRRDVLRTGAAFGALGSVLALSGCLRTEPDTSTPAPAASGAAALDPRGSRGPRPRTVGGLSMIAAQRGEQLLLHTDGGDVTFWGGVNLGSTLPGHSPGEHIISAEDYRRWFPMMRDLGIRVLRVYTIHPPHFYAELRAHNLANPHNPLYLVHGVYLPDESYLKTGDLYAAAPTRAMSQEVRDASAAVHGDLTRKAQPGRAGGTWTADVSPWLAAWLVGVEWDPAATAASDRRNAAAPRHKGHYVESAPAATPTERWIAARMDELATAEAARGTCAPLAFVNWPTTDPLSHPDEPLDTEDLVGVDANHIRVLPSWPAGTFASYHAYPYYPDFQLLQPSYASSGDNYRAYLQDLHRHHRGLPLLVTELGVPSSLGAAHRGSPGRDGKGRDQGHHSESEAMAMDAALVRLVHDAGFGGAFLFSWTDEWFKFTWNTLERHSVVDGERRSLWHDPLTNEQFFGLLAQDPVRVGERTLHEARTGVRRVALDHDASYLYLTVDADPGALDRVRFGFDIVPGGLPLPGGGGSGRDDVALVVGTSARTATAYVRGEIDPIRLDGLPAGVIPRPGTDGWSVQRMTLNRPIHTATTTRPVELLDIGHLVHGAWDDGNSVATWEVHDLDIDGAPTTRLSTRLPWSMLLMADPSSKTAVVPEPLTNTAERRDKFGPKKVPVTDVALTVLTDNTEISLAVTWEGWNQASYRERSKVGLDQVRAAFLGATRG